MGPVYPELAGRVALVTGGSRGIGAATARLLAKSGVRVAVNGRDEAAIAAVVRQIEAEGGVACGVAADCTDAAALERLLGRVEEALGPVEILAAFAGGGGRPRPLTEIDEATWRDVLDANLTSTFLTVRAMLPGMLARRRGCIVTMASTAGRQPGGASAPYAAAKAAVIMLTRHIARELGPQGVRANCLAPSAILTERSRAQMSEEQQRQLAQVFPLGRAGEPEDVAAAAVFLASDGAAWLTGITLDVAGGRITG